MHKSYSQIVWLKQLDMWLQAGSFLVMICYAFIRPGFIALYITGMIQLLSIIYWAVILHRRPVCERHRTLQRSFFLMATVLIVSGCYSTSLLTLINMFVLLWLGPLLGIIYFITTFQEIAFYRSLVHRDAI